MLSDIVIKINVLNLLNGSFVNVGYNIMELNLYVIWFVFI